MTGGGNLFWIAGDNIDPASYNAMNEAAGGQLLPAPLVDIRLPQAGEDRDSWKISDLDKEHGAMSQLLQPASLYQSVLIYKHLRMDTADAPQARVLARLDDGEALLTQAQVEQGPSPCSARAFTSDGPIFRSAQSSCRCWLVSPSTWLVRSRPATRPLRGLL